MLYYKVVFDDKSFCFDLPPEDIQVRNTFLKYIYPDIPHPDVRFMLILYIFVPIRSEICVNFFIYLYQSDARFMLIFYIFVPIRSEIYVSTIMFKNNEKNDKFYRKVASLMYMEMFNFMPQAGKQLRN